MAGLDAFGIALQRSDMAEPEVFTAIATVTNVSGPETESETSAVTAHDSESGWREFIGRLKDGGEVSRELNYAPRDHHVRMADYEDTEPRNYKLVFPQNLGEWALKLILTGFSQEAPVDDKLSAEVTFKVSGKPEI